MKLARGRIKAQDFQKELDRVLSASPVLSSYEQNSTGAALPSETTFALFHSSGAGWRAPQLIESIDKVFHLYNEIGYPEVLILRGARQSFQPETRTVESTTSINIRMGEKEV